MKRFLFGILSILILCSSGQAAEPPDTAQTAQWVQVQVSGLSCPFCAYGLEKKLKKLERTTDRHLHFEEGMLSMKVLPGGANLSEIAGAIRKAGFTPGRIQIQDHGDLKQQDEGWFFVSSTTGETFAVAGEIKADFPGIYKIRAKVDELPEKKGGRATLRLLANPAAVSEKGKPSGKQQGVPK